MKIYVIKYQDLYSDEVKDWESDSLEDAYFYFNERCKSCIKCKLYKNGKLISTFINSKWKPKKKR